MLEQIIPRENPLPALVEFIMGWVPDLGPQHRIPAAEIPDFVPPPLRAIYELAGSYPTHYSKQWRMGNWQAGLFGKQDQLIPPDQLELKDGRFYFIHENQGVWTCEAGVNVADPPVYSDSQAYEYGEPEGSMRIVCDSLAHFLTTFCLQELTFRSPHRWFVDIDAANPESLCTTELKNLWLHGQYVYPTPWHSFYLCERKLLIMATDIGYFLASQDPADRALINPDLPIRD